MTTELLTATPDMPIAEAAQVMLRHKVGCLPVLDGERLVGLITEADFVKHVAALSSG
jgi:CBS domain-containing membrane protein